MTISRQRLHQFDAPRARGSTHQTAMLYLWIPRHLSDASITNVMSSRNVLPVTNGIPAAYAMTQMRTTSCRSLKPASCFACFVRLLRGCQIHALTVPSQQPSTTATFASCGKAGNPSQYITVPTVASAGGASVSERTTCIVKYGWTADLESSFFFVHTDFVIDLLRLYTDVDRNLTQVH